MPRQQVKHLDAAAPSTTGKSACGVGVLTGTQLGSATRIKTTLNTFIDKTDGLHACWRCRQTAIYTSLGGTSSSY